MLLVLLSFSTFQHDHPSFPRSCSHFLRGPIHPIPCKTNVTSCSFIPTIPSPTSPASDANHNPPLFPTLQRSPIFAEQEISMGSSGTLSMSQCNACTVLVQYGSLGKKRTRPLTTQSGEPNSDTLLARQLVPLGLGDSLVPYDIGSCTNGRRSH